MNRIIITLGFLLLAAAAQAQYTAQGKIEFERKMNLHRQMDEWQNDDNNEWVERFKSQMPKFYSSFFNLSFNTKKTMYRPGKETENPMKAFGGGGPAAENIVLTDLQAGRVTAAKQIYEQKYIVEDSVRKMQWKITDEIRTIANYKCHKAVGKICDSVYVVAFYTEDIMVSGGPEMFGGLPGMILELAVPRLATTWVATKVEIDAPAEADFVMPAGKGKKVTQKELFNALQSGLKDWGKYASRNIWWSML
jgi:GLPGLI family protein